MLTAHDQSIDDATALERQQHQFGAVVVVRSVTAVVEQQVVVDTAGALVHQNPAASQILGDRLSEFLPADDNRPTSFRQADQLAPYTASALPLAQGVGEALTPAAFGFSILGFVWLLIALAVRKAHTPDV